MYLLLQTDNRNIINEIYVCRANILLRNIHYNYIELYKKEEEN